MSPTTSQEEAKLRKTAGALIDRIYVDQVLPENARDTFRQMLGAGMTLDEEQREQIEIVIQRIEDGRAGIMTVAGLTRVPEALQGTKAFDRLVSWASDHRTELRSRTLEASQGGRFAAVARRVSETGMSGYLADALAKADTWNLEGLARGDLIFLVQAREARVRQQGLRLICLVKKRAETQRISRTKGC